MKNEVSPCEHGYYGLCPRCIVEEYNALRARVAELERERDQLALSLSATKAERDHAVRSAELLGDELHNSESARRDFEYAWLEGRAIMAVCGYFSRMRGPDEWCCVSKDGFTKRRVGTRQLAEMHSREGWTITPLYAGSAPVPAAQAEAKVADDVRLGNRLYVWDHENPEDGSWDNIEEYLHDTTPGVGDVVRLNLAMPLRDVEVEMLEVGRSGEPVRWEVRDVKTGAILAAKAKGGAK